MTHEGSNPGEILRVRFLRRLNMSRKQLAEKSGIALARLDSLLAGRSRIRELDAYRLGLAFPEAGESYWKGLQDDYDRYRKLPVGEQLKVMTKAKSKAKKSKMVARRGSPILIIGILPNTHEEQSYRCAYRPECLNVAAKRNAQGFSCEGCPDRNDIPVVTETYRIHHLAENT